MKATAVHRLHGDEVWNPAAAVPVLPTCLAGAPLLSRWPWSTVCQVHTEQCSPQCFAIKFRYWLKTWFDTVVRIPRNIDSCVTCQFNTAVPVISSLYILALGKMRTGFCCMGGMLLAFQEKTVVISVLLDCASIPRSKKRVDTSVPYVWHSEGTLPITS